MCGIRAAQLLQLPNLVPIRKRLLKKLLAELMLDIEASKVVADGENAAAQMLEGLTKKLGVTFQRIDLRDVHDFSGLQERAKDLGWSMETPSPSS